MSGTGLKSVGSALLASVATYGYGALAVGVLLENAGVPVPGETMLLTASALAARGRLSIVLVAATAAAAAVIGDNIGFAVGRLGGRPFLTRFGRWLFITPERLRTMDRFFARRGPVAVFFARFIAGLRVVAALVAGSSAMPWRTFLLYNALGAVAWATVVSAVGYLGGDLAFAALPWIRSAHVAIWAIAGAVVIVTLIAHAIVWEAHERELRRKVRGRR